MCELPGFSNSSLTKTSPECALTQLLSKDLNCYVPSQAVRLFVKLHWPLLCKLAHEIHDDGTAASLIAAQSKD